eukprot:gene13007-biopygen7348
MKQRGRLVNGKADYWESDGNHWSTGNGPYITLQLPRGFHLTRLELHSGGEGAAHDPVQIRVATKKETAGDVPQESGSLKLPVGQAIGFEGFSGVTIARVNDDGTYDVHIPGVEVRKRVPRDKFSLADSDVDDDTAIMAAWPGFLKLKTVQPKDLLDDMIGDGMGG